MLRGQPDPESGGDLDDALGLVAGRVTGLVADRVVALCVDVGGAEGLSSMNFAGSV
ncbi:hypothetical protein [Nonomuraea terrae]|uniref:hypothetical protein n=1 Tax=Nonomuraea terrae TaxID=2530383 RepID=UPI00319E0CBB